MNEEASGIVARRQDTEADCRPTLDLAGVGEAQLDPATGAFLRVNPRMCEITGYPEAELRGMTLRDITHPDERGEVLERLRRIVRGEAPEESAVEERYARKDGSVAWVSVTATVERDEAGRAACVAVAVQDITGRKEAEEVARQQAGLLEQTHDAVFMWELGGGISYWNKGAEVLYGWSREEAVGSVSHELLKTMHPFPIEELDRRLRAEGQWEGELVHHARDGRQVMVESRHRLTSYGAGSGGFVMETNRDVTERKEAEEALREVREAERRRIARDLHDEPLQDLVYALEEMRDARARAEPGELGLGAGLGRAIEALERATLGLRGAIYDLRLEGDREQSLVEMLGSLVELHHRNWPGCEIEFVIEGYSAPDLSKEAEVNVLRVVQEALTNARRHSGARNVRVSLGSSGESLRVEVSDDGRGFDPEAPAGTGTVGMRERAHALHADLMTVSEPGKGTKVRLETPLKETGGETPRGEEGVAREDVTRILLIEDHASFREAVASVFEAEPGFTVVGQAGSLEEARALLAETETEPEASRKVDVAVVDLGLVDGYGWDWIRELRAANPSAMALVLTASLDRAEAARAVEAGAAGVLHKSVGLGKVVDAVRRLRAGESLLALEEVVDLLRYAGSRREEEHEARRAIARLTPREKEVLRALAEGLDGKEIARRLHISDKTENNHMANILAKLRVHSRLQALVFALRNDVVDLH